MPPWMDLHTHTYLCQHAEGKPVDYVRVAAQNGIQIMGCADHSPMPAHYDSYRMTPEQWTRYTVMVREAQEEGKRLNVEVLWGVEADWMEARNDETLALIHDHPLDYVIGSVHYVNTLAFDDPMNISLWENPEIADEIWTHYIEKLYELVDGIHPNIIGHIDLPKKFGYYPNDKVWKEVTEKFNELFHKLARENIAIELNTSGWFKEIKEQYPSEKLLCMAHDAGVNLTLGSDAHAPSEVGRNFTKAGELLRQCKIRNLTYFVQRTPRTIDL